MLTQEQLDAIEAEAACKLIIPIDELNFSGDEGYQKLVDAGYKIVNMDNFTKRLYSLHARWNRETLAMVQHIKEQAAEIERLKGGK